MQLRINSIILLGLIAIGPFCAEFPETAFETRAWVLLDYDMPYLRKMISRAAEQGINHIQFCHHIGMDLQEYLEPDRNRDIRELIALCHKHGIKAYAWTHELDETPERFIQGGKVAAHGDAFWQWMGDRYRTLLKALPDIDGVVVTLTETEVPIDDDNLVISPLTPLERFSRMAREIHDVLHPAGKELILRTFTWIPEDYDWMLEAFKEIPDDITIMTKVNWGDWFQHYPSNPFIGKVAPHKQIVEFDLTGQYHGDTYTPWVYADYLQEQIRYARSQNAAGIIGRTEWEGHTYGSANEMNGVAFAALAQNPDCDLETLWQDWATKKYGPEAAPHIISALKRSNEIANLVYFTLSFKIFKFSGRMEPLSYMDGTRIMHCLFCRDVQARWKPELIPIAEELLNPTMQTLEKSVQEKEKAIELIKASMADINLAKPYLSKADYQYLTGLFQNAGIIASSWRWINEAYFRYWFLHKGDQSQRPALDAVLTKVHEHADRIENQNTKASELLSPTIMRSFCSDIESLIDPPVKWFVPTNCESGKDPVLFDITGDGVGEIVINGRDNRIHAFNRGGQEVWFHNTFGLRVRYPNISDPATEDINGDGHEELLAGAADGNLYVFDNAGRLLWKFKTGNGIVSKPVFIPGSQNDPIVICASLDGTVYGLSTDGKMRWKYDAGVISANPVITNAKDSRVVFATDGGRVFALDAAGTLCWGKQLPSSLTGSPAIHQIDDTTVISVASDEGLYLFDQDGNDYSMFTFPQASGAANTPALSLQANGEFRLYTGTDQGHLLAYDSNGKLCFDTQLGDEIRTQPLELKYQDKSYLAIGAGNSIVITSLDGEIKGRYTGTQDGLIGTGLLYDDRLQELIYTALDRKLYVLDIRQLLN